MKRISIALLLLTATLTPALAAADRWQPNDRLRLVSASDPQISADGKTVLIVVGRANAKDNRYDSDLVAVDVATATQRPLTFDRRGIASPRMGVDGRMAFLANDKNGK